jgi:hypothetical protein
MIRASIDYRD